MHKYINRIFIFGLTILLISCEEVIDIDLNQAHPALVVEAIIFKDSLSSVRLTQTTNYFSIEDPIFLDDATVIIHDGSSSDELIYTENGYYKGNSLVGTEGITYNLEITHNGNTYLGTSYMPAKSEIISVSYSKSNSQSTLNPYGNTVFTFNCKFSDDPRIDNYYLVRFLNENNELLERYYLLTENTSNSGSFSNSNDTISFEESIFFEGGKVRVQLLSVDESIYKYFLELSDILFWKRRIISPSSYNPESNINAGALGYFAAWSIDSDTLILE